MTDFTKTVMIIDIVGVYTLLTIEEVFRLVFSLVVFRRKSWMKTLA